MLLGIFLVYFCYTIQYEAFYRLVKFSVDCGIMLYDSGGSVVEVSEIVLSRDHGTEHSQTTIQLETK